MRYWGLTRRLASGVLLAGIALLTPALLHGSSNAPDKDKKEEPPKLTVRATPVVSFSPSRIFVSADLVGGSDDYQSYYCPTIEWKWGDGTSSEASADCDPYQPGKSEIERHYAVQHVYTTPGRYRILFMLKQNGKALASASSEVMVRPGLGGPGGR
jgi:hypothetical protein